MPNESADLPTTHSRQRLALAQRLARTYPGRASAEIAVTGSTAAGMADSYSDVELNIWDDVIPPIDDRLEWLRNAGATDVSTEADVTADGTEWTTCRYEGTWVEIGWQTVESVDRILNEILTGTITSHDVLLIAGMLLRAVSLRTSGLLQAWQQRVAIYPDPLAERLIDSAVAEWVWPNWIDTRWALIGRGESLALQETLVGDIQRVLRILFAVNRRWEPNWKWARSESRLLEIAPKRLGERIDSVFHSGDARERVAASLELILDTLTLASSPKIRRAEASIRERLAARAIRQLQDLDGLDLDRPEVMDSAWRSGR